MMTDVAPLYSSDRTSCLRDFANQGSRDHTERDIMMIWFTCLTGTIRRRREEAYWSA